MRRSTGKIPLNGTEAGSISVVWPPLLLGGIMLLKVPDSSFFAYSSYLLNIDPAQPQAIRTVLGMKKIAHWFHLAFICRSYKSNGLTTRLKFTRCLIYLSLIKTANNV